MSIQIHCDQCDKSLHKRVPYASEKSSVEPRMVRLFQDEYGFGGRDYSGWAFCDNYCAGDFFYDLHYKARGQNAAAKG